MTGLSNDLQEAVDQRQPPEGCSLCRIASSLDTDDYAALLAALSSRIGYRAIGKILRKNGHAVVDEHIRLHRTERHGQ